MNDIKIRKITENILNDNIEIQKWLRQFEESDKDIAKNLLMQLDFIHETEFSHWLTFKINKEFSGKHCALYAVRKFDSNTKNLWDDEGITQSRPATTLGSEDYVISIIRNIIRNNKVCFFDHPSLEVMKENRIKNIILIDDSIGSGNRISTYLSSMLKNKTFKSWLSLNYIKISIISYARTYEAEEKIKKNINIKKIKFFSQILYNRPVAKVKSVSSNSLKNKEENSIKNDFCNTSNETILKTRWGENWKDILELCDKYEKIPKDKRRGYGDMMCNIVFYNSVPNNLPGILHSRGKGKEWFPLFQNRVIPTSIKTALEEANEFNMNYTIIKNIKKGIRLISSLAKRTDLDESVVNEIIMKLERNGLIQNMKLTDAGYNFFHKNKKNENKSLFEPNYDLYIPLCRHK